MRYLLPGLTSSFPDALHRLLRDDIEPNVDGRALHDQTAFRERYCYIQECHIHSIPAPTPTLALALALALALGLTLALALALALALTLALALALALALSLIPTLS